MKKRMPRLAETSCGSKAPNLTLTLKDRRPLVPAQDVALLTVVGLAGTVGLMCVGLVITNWKLQRGKARECTSEHLDCGTFHAPPSALEARGGRATGCCNCRLTQEGEVEATSAVGSRKEALRSQEHGHQVSALLWKPTGADPEGYDAYFGLDGTVLPAGHRAPFDDRGPAARHCPRRPGLLSALGPGAARPQPPMLHTARADISSDTFRRHAASASALARTSLAKPLTKESWQPRIEREDNAGRPEGYGRLLTSSSSQPCEPGQLWVGKPSHSHRSKHEDPHGLRKWSEPRYFQPRNSFICKYISCDQLQDYFKEKQPGHRAQSKAEKEQLQVDRAIEKFLKSELKRRRSTRRVGVLDPAPEGGRQLLVSPTALTHWLPQGAQSHPLATLGLTKPSNPGDTKEGREQLERRRLKSADPRHGMEGQNFRVKLSFPFRKTKVYPEKPLAEPKKRKHKPLLPKKFTKTSEKKPKARPVSPASCPLRSQRNSCLKGVSTELPLRRASKQTPHYEDIPANSPRLGAKDLSVQDSGHPAGHELCAGSSAAPGVWGAEHRCAHPPLSPGQAGALEHPASFPPSWENPENNVPAFLHPRAVDGSSALESTRCTGWDTFKTSAQSQTSLSCSSQTQFLGVHMTEAFSKDHTSGQNKVAQHEEQSSCHEQLGNEEKSKISHQITKSSTRDKQRDGGGKLIPNTETPRSQQSLLLMPSSVPPPNGTGCPEEGGTSTSQATWDVANSLSSLLRENHTEAPSPPGEKGDKIHEGEMSPRTLLGTRPVTSMGTAGEQQLSRETTQGEGHVSRDSSSVEDSDTGVDLSISSRPQE